MNSKLLKTCFCFFLIDNATGVNPTIKVDANEGYIKIEGEIKDVIMARFPEKKLKLLKDNGDDADEEDRTYTFEVLRLTKAGAKLKLSADKEISYNNGNFSISKENSDKSVDIFELNFLLFGPFVDGNRIQRIWEKDDTGYSYTFEESNNVGTWSIVAKLKTSIEKQKSGKFSGCLKISISAD